MSRPAKWFDKIALAACLTLGCLALASGLVAVPAAAAPGAILDLAGCKANALPASDDASTAAVPLGFTANFGGTSYTQVYVNNNGNVTFGQPFGEFFDFDYWVPERAIVAPFLADVDTRGTGSTPVTYGQTVFDGQPAFCVDWLDVGYFDGHSDKLNSFQLLLVQRGAGAFDIVFNYDKVQWETGDDLSAGGENGFGGLSASWGYANGDGESVFVGDGSFTNGTLVDGGSAALTANSNIAGQLGRYVYSIQPPSGPKLSGQVTADGAPVAFSPVEICPAGAGSCITRSTNATGQYRAYGLAGSYYLTAFPPATSERNRGHAGPVTIESTDIGQDVALGTPPMPPPDGTSITSFYTTDAGIPVTLWESQPTLTTHGCPGGWAAAVQRTSRGNFEGYGQMTEGPPGTYTRDLVPARLGNTVTIQISVNCPSPADNRQIEFDLYVVPNGRVTSEAGWVSDADVLLLRGGSPTGPFVPVLPGSALLSPSNRFNPDITFSAGQFGWDVPAGGYYKVQASRPDCVSDADRTSAVAESEVLTMQPPSTSLLLRLYCPPIVEPPPDDPPPADTPPPSTTTAPPPTTIISSPLASPPTRTATSVFLDVTPEPARRGTTLKAKAKLRIASGPLPNTVIKFYFRAKGAADWTYRAKATTGSRGIAVRTFTAKSTGDWKVRYAGSPKYLADTAVDRVKVVR